MDRSYLPSKPAYLHRPRLDQMLDQGLLQPLVTVVAGPGYGKTLAVSSYVKQLSQTLIWLRFRKLDNDPHRFREQFINAVNRELPHLARTLERIVRPIEQEDFHSVIHLLSLEAAKGSPIILVVDDFDNIQSPVILKFFDLLADASIDNLSLIFISNTKLPLGAFIPSGSHFRISKDDLKFTLEETDAYLRLNGIELPPEAIEKTVIETDGWPLAIHSICIKHNIEPGGRLPENNISRQLSAELFHRDYFSQYDEPIQNLLVMLSFFESFPLDFIKMLARDDADEATRLLSLNVFIDYDYANQFFVFQYMYRDFLTTRQALLSAEEVQHLHDIAGGWYRQHHYILDALDCYWFNKDYDAYLAALIEIPKQQLNTTLSNHLLSQLNQFPAEYAQANAAVDFSRAFMLLNDMQIQTAHHLFLQLAERLQGRTDQESQLILGDIYVTLADINILLNSQPYIILDYIKKALTLLPDGSRSKSQETLVAGNNRTFYLPDNKPGQVPNMVSFFEEFSLYNNILCKGSGYGLELLAAAEAAYLIDDYELAKVTLMKTIAKASITHQHDIICNAYCEMMQLHVFHGDYWQSKKWLNKMRAYVNEHDIIGLDDLLYYAESWFYILMGDYNLTVQKLTERGNIRNRHPLHSGRDMIIAAQYYLHANQPELAAAEISKMEDILVQKGMWYEKILTYITKAQWFLLTGDKTAAVQAFYCAYDMLYQNNITIIFVQFGKPLQKLIRMVRQQEEFEFDNEWLNVIYRKSGSYDKRVMAMRKAYDREHHNYAADDLELSKTEKNILIFIAQGMTRDEIAAHTNISLASVKRHITSIYTKLGAVNRADAVHIATANGLIDLK